MITGSPVKAAHQELASRLAVERERFTALGTQAARAAQGLQSTTPPDEELLAGLAAAVRAFGELRQAVLAEALLLLDVPPAPESLATLKDLVPVLEALITAEDVRIKRDAWEKARDGALRVLDRVADLIHREDASFTPLAESQASAREARQQIAGSRPEDFDAVSKRVSERVRAFADLVALGEGWSALDDEKCATLQDSIAQAFGRPLALAALRGKLGRAGETPRPAPPPRQPRAAAPAAPPPSPPPPSVVSAPPPARPVPAEAPAFEPLPRIAAPPPAPAPTAPAPPAAPARPAAARPAPPPRRVEPPAPTQAPAAPTRATALPEDPEQRAKAVILERLAAEQAPWWVHARAGWLAMRAAGQSLEAAAGPMLERFPTLLSVPIQRATDFEDGRFAEGYALLLEHVNQLEEGFVGEALARLNPQFTATWPESYQVGPELYRHLVAEGRLYRTYPDFLRAVLAGALPRPGFWVQGGLTESEAETHVFTRPNDPVGATRKETKAFDEDAQRYTAHAFNVTVAPLTTRFFTLEGAGPFEDQRTVEVKLTEGGAASDRAWLVTLGADGAAAPPRKHRVGGTKLEDLGKAYRTLWIAVFNPDPTNEKRYALTLTLGKKVPPPSKKEREAAAAKPSLFKRRG